MLFLQFRKPLNNQKGSALLLAVILISVLSILALGLGTMVNSEFRAGVSELRSRKAVYLAEAGINKAIYELSLAGLTTNTLFPVDSQDNRLFHFQDSIDGTPDYEVDPTSGDVVKIEVHNNETYLVIEATATLKSMGSPYTIKTIKATVYNGYDPMDSNKRLSADTVPMQNYIITEWKEF